MKKSTRERNNKPTNAQTEKPVGPEIIFGLVAPVGVNLDELTAMLTEELANVNYETQSIKLSQLLHDFQKYSALAEPMYEDKRINAHMDAGNDFRDRTKTIQTRGIMSLDTTVAIL